MREKGATSVCTAEAGMAETVLRLLDGCQVQQDLSAHRSNDGLLQGLQPTTLTTSLGGGEDRSLISNVSGPMQWLSLSILYLSAPFTLHDI